MIKAAPKGAVLPCKKHGKNVNGSKACAWLIYKSAAKLTVRLTPHRHPRASRSGAEAKRTPEQKTEQNRTKGAAAAEPSR